MLHAILAEDFNFWLPKPASANAAAYDALFYFILAINIIFSSLIMAIMIYFVVRYAHRKGTKSNPTAGHSTALELTWTVIPTLIVLGIFYYGFRGYIHANTIPKESESDEVTANGSMWSWQFTYPNGVNSPELHMVAGHWTRMTLNSEDVIHDLAIPSFRMKKDVVPGRYNQEWYEPNVPTAPDKVGISYEPSSKLQVDAVEKTEAYGLYKGDDATALATADLNPGDTYGFQMTDGKVVGVYTRNGYTTTVELDAKDPAKKYSWKHHEYYQIYCAMYCGQNHWIMLAHCIVHPDKHDKTWTPEADFDTWMAREKNWEPRMSFIQRGEQLYKTASCSGCHSVTGVNAPYSGPTWLNLYGSDVPLDNGKTVKADDEYIHESIVNPDAKIVKGYANPSIMTKGFDRQLTANDITALTWYMKSISSNYPKDKLAEGNVVGGALKKAPAAAPAILPATAPGTVHP